MRVLHVIPAVAPRYGGPSTAIWHMAASLAKAGVDVEIATTDSDGPVNRILHADLPETTVPVHLLPGPTHRPLARWLGANVHKYDLIHTHGLWNLHATAACSAARRYGVPYIVRPCGMLSGYSWRRKWLKKRVYWWAAERRNVLGAAAVHATSPGEREDVLRCGVTAPVYDIPLGMEAAAFETPRRPNWLRDRCGPASGKRPIVLFLSRLHPKKGVTDILLPAFAGLKVDAFLAVVGGVDDSTPRYGNDVWATVERLGLTDRVALLGPVPPADRWAAFDGADAFVLPSHSENFGLVVTEAMARGCPVIVTDAVQSCDHVTASGAGVVVAVTAIAVAAGIEGLLAAPAMYPLSSGAREYVRENLAWDPISGKIATMYQQALGAREICPLTETGLDGETS